MYFGPDRKLNRLNGFDYSEPGLYFVTICVAGMQHLLGEVRHGIMGLNEWGCVVYDFWQQIPKHYENVEIDQFVIMPNHVHGIIYVKEIETGHQSNHVGTAHCAVRTDQCSVPTTLEKQKPVLNYGLVSKIINAFKAITSRQINQQQNHFYFEWQRSFYDHIINDEQSLKNIREYIYFNPTKWDIDQNNTENLYI